MMNLRKKLFWISILYFAEGLPFGIFRDMWPVYFRQNGVSLKEIGFMTFLTLPWSIKFLWSPIVDRFGDRRSWVLYCCTAMAGLIVVVPLLDPTRPTTLLLGILVAFTFASATQDITIDAYAIGLVSKGEEGVTNSFRAASYQVAVVVGGGVTMWLIHPLGWTGVYLLLGVMFLLLAIVARLAPPVPVAHRAPRDMARQFWRFVSRPGSIAVFLFILTFRLDVTFIGVMVKPFWVDQGMTPGEIGTISTTLGAVLVSVGAIVGGLITTRIGIFNALWSLGLAQAAPNLVYAAVAHWSLGRPWLYTASCLESLGTGLGTAAFLSFLMRICDKDQAATQYALLTAIYGMTRFLGGWSGVGVERLGYDGFFALTFLIALPCYLLLPWVRDWCANGAGPESGASPEAAPGRRQPEHASQLDGREEFAGPAVR
jgi:MFS transporter, PAT family, beta-lactamase induction signal transducer AmpG